MPVLEMIVCVSFQLYGTGSILFSSGFLTHNRKMDSCALPGSFPDRYIIIMCLRTRRKMKMKLKKAMLLFTYKTAFPVSQWRIFIISIHVLYEQVWKNTFPVPFTAYSDEIAQALPLLPFYPFMNGMYSRSLSCTCLCGRFSASRTRILSPYAPRTPQKFGHN